ncbi:OLC1v1022568C1 [Oldenlandia corymbosa var. corymbosa]|uniref:FRIGIDA-like protein n=1 Tax=Oldenlandia corymbosa var. corymbosa TaxID=529605 RepID=A0AAV1BY47_OLDCO|nr:OLC1v1022568C1 [Oldenlandia corymbosa var. corymbosa]
MATTETLRSISVGLEAIDEKKAQLRRAFEELQAHSSLIPSSSSSTSSFTNLKWADIDSYFTSLQSGLQAKFALLKSAKPVPEGPQPPPQPESAANIKSGSATSEPLPPQPESKAKRKASLSVPEPVPSAGPVPVRPELKSFCEKMDSFGLRDFLLARPRERAVIRDELADAWKHARDPAMLVVDAMQGITGDGSSGGVADVTGLRRVSVALLEALMRAKVEIGAQVKEKAMAIAVEWNRNIAAGVSSEGDDDGLEKLCFLQLVATFGLVENDLFNMNDLVEYAVAIARHRQAVDLCRVIGFGDRICDVITKLISGGKILVAVKFIFQFEQTEKFPPVPLLRGCISETKKIGQKARRTGGRSGKNFRQSWVMLCFKCSSSLGDDGPKNNMLM